MSAFSEWQDAMDAYVRQLSGSYQVLVAQNRELIEHMAAQDERHDEERVRMHKHLSTMHGHLYRLIDEKRDRELEEAAFEEEAWRQQRAQRTRPTAVGMDLGLSPRLWDPLDSDLLADIARYQTEVTPNPISLGVRNDG